MSHPHDNRTASFSRQADHTGTADEAYSVASNDEVDPFDDSDMFTLSGISYKDPKFYEKVAEENPAFASVLSMINGSGHWGSGGNQGTTNGPREADREPVESEYEEAKDSLDPSIPEQSTRGTTLKGPRTRKHPDGVRTFQAPPGEAQGSPGRLPSV
jgi:hypothetical protein